MALHPPLPAYEVPDQDIDLLSCGVNYGTLPEPVDRNALFRARRAHALTMTRQHGGLWWMGIRARTEMKQQERKAE